MLDQPPKLLAAFFDSADNGFDIGDVGAVFLIIAAIVGAVAALWKWIAQPQISKQIIESTKPIQTNTNGDSINARVNLIISRQDEIATELRAVRKDVSDVHGRVTEHIEWHLDHAEGRSRTRSTDPKE